MKVTPMNRFFHMTFAPLSIAALVALPAAVTFTFMPTEAAAEKGGNGNGNGRANNSSREDRRNGRSSRNRDTQEAQVRPGRGEIASELKGLNAAHASPTALANASPDSMPGKLYAYQQAVLAEREYDAQLLETEDTYVALENMTEEEFLELNPDLDYAQTLAATLARLTALQEAAAGAEGSTESTLTALTGGQDLSEGAMQELARLLGL